nr:GNAT family N-acetyltransferase [Brevibacillus sp. SYP-B805]
MLSYAVEAPAVQKINQIVQSYIGHGDLFLFGMELDDMLIGLIGVQLLASNQAIIKHISVHPGYRHRGWASRMINRVIEHFNLESISAETDNDAVGFYKKFGFAASSLGEKYPGVERFLCVYRVE